ncbi:MAG TPA: MnmC family methyltransferase [Kofleriaceae bacterium]|nr:MnmC family methyltransferase [Kofleriaceae bacterium]
MSDHEVVTTRSGARAMLDRATGQVMHPVVGPLAEAEELYVAPSRLAERLSAPAREPLVVLDVGLGAGSNAVAAWRVSEARAGGRVMEIVSFDRTVAALALALEPDHAPAFGLDGPAGAAARALLADGCHATPRTTWRLVLGDLPGALSATALAADVVFWDPFSPSANPDLWSLAAFAALRSRCGDRATVHTYSAATSTRAAMLLAGFAVGAGASTGTMGQTTVGAIDPADLAQPLDRRWLDRLRRSSAPLPVDAPVDAFDRIAAMRQFVSWPPVPDL